MKKAIISASTSADRDISIFGIVIPFSERITPGSSLLGAVGCCQIIVPAITIHKQAAIAPHLTQTLFFFFGVASAAST